MSSASPRRASDSQSVDARCTPHVHRRELVVALPPRSPVRSLVRSLARWLVRPLSSSRADAPARRDVVQRLRNAWNAAALRMRAAYLTRNRRTAGSVMSLDDDLTIVCGDLTETCAARGLCPSTSASSFSFPFARSSPPPGLHPSLFLRRRRHPGLPNARRTTTASSALLHRARHLLYLTLPAVAARQRLILFAAYRDTRETQGAPLSFSLALFLRSDWARSV